MDLDETLLDLRPQGLWGVDPGARRALLARVLEGRPDGGGDDGLHLGGGVDEVVVLAAALPDQLGEAGVVLQVLPNRLPQPLEGGHGAGEVDARQVGVRRHRFAKDRAVCGDEVDDPVRETSVAEDLVDQIVGEDRCVAWLPHADVAHHTGGVGEVAGDGGEVERGDGGDEALEGAVAEQVESGGGVLADRLVAVQLLGEEAVEPEQERGEDRIVKERNLKKSISSHAESISAWMMVLACPSMVVAFRSALYWSAIWSATFRNIWILSLMGTASQSFLAAKAVSMLSWTSSGVAQ